MTTQDPENSGSDNPEIEQATDDVANHDEVASPIDDGDLIQQLEQAQKKADDNWNELLRTRADMENLRRRQSRDLENAHKHALDKFVTELLPIYDSMALGSQAASAEEASIDGVREGLDMTIKMFLSSIAKFGLEVVDPQQGDEFNPELHQAMAMQEHDNLEANKVISVAQKGFQFNGRLLRPAMVMVSQ